MSWSDPLSDMLTRIRNAYMAGHDVVEIPYSNLKSEVSRVMKREGYITDFVVEGGNRKTLRVYLKYTSEHAPVIRGLKRESRPGLRHYVEAGALPLVLGGLGTAIISTSAGVMTGNVKGLVLVDVTPLTLGIETEHDVFVPIIERNSCIPTARGRTFTTVSDGQSSVEVHVLQGERAQASNNFSLGRFSLEGIEPAPRGVPRVEVIFDIDVNGIVHVRAQDEKTGLFEEIEINAADTVSDEDIERILHEAAAHREEDELFIGRHQLVKQARMLLARIRARSGADAGALLNESPEIEELVEYIETVLHGDDIRQIRNAIETMNVYLNEMAAV